MSLSATDMETCMATTTLYFKQETYLRISPHWLLSVHFRKLFSAVQHRRQTVDIAACLVSRVGRSRLAAE